MKLVVATRNNGKLKEIKNYLKDYSIVLKCLTDYPQIPEIKEIGETFYDNAFLKAKTVSRLTNLPTLADDSGLEIDYLGGKPGVYSSRWGKTNQERIKKVIQALQNTKEEERKAHFVCVMSLVTPEGGTFTTEGICTGKITLLPKGQSGFGYDPIFIPDGYNLTFAQLGPDIKNNISHRAMALRKMVRIIIDYYQLK